MDVSGRATKKPFRYECMWERDPWFGDVLEGAWSLHGWANSLAAFSEKMNSVVA